MASGGYYVATHILMVWKRLAGLAPDQPHGWSFPDESSIESPANGREEIVHIFFHKTHI